MRYLKVIRRIFATLFFISLLFLFLDFAAVAPSSFYVLAHLQIVPALLNGFFIGVALIFLLTFIGGRWYCSFICPLGILQDGMLKLRQWVGKEVRWLPKLKFRYTRPLNGIRYTLLIITIISYLFGSVLCLTLLDPYSAFGKIIYTIAQPVYMLVNNLLASLAHRVGIYDLYTIALYPAPSQMWLYVGVILSVLLIMVSYRGRLFCNTLCPVGAGLSLFSYKSRMGIVIDKERCNGCKKCVGQCKAECIDGQTHCVDKSRCVVCFNCIGACQQSAIRYQWIGRQKKEFPLVETPPSQSQQTRKEFLQSLSVGPLLLTGLTACGSKNGSSSGNRYPIPPGAVSINRFKQKCTACQLCVSKCPSHVLKPALFENGISGVMQPYLMFDVHRFCEYECKKCIEVCPNGALMPFSLEEKKQAQIGIVRFHQEACIVYRDEMFCGACAEHCPTQAVKMVDYKEGLTIPVIDIAYCIGCGACESICPERPHAIFVESLSVHKRALPPFIEEKEERVVDDFGF